MASRATGGTFAAFLISGAILGFAGGAFLGTQAEGNADDGGNTPNSSATAPVDGNDAGGSDSPDPGESPDPTDGAPSDGAISLTAEEDAVAAGERINISGTIDPPEEGVQLQLQRAVDGADYEDFPISAWETDADGNFGGFVESGQGGENSFRVVRVDDDSIVSDEIIVTVS